MNSPLLIISVISVFACIQSVFGMGILVFGTPTLLLLGESFPETLAWLLPASVAVSSAQVLSDLERSRAVWRGGKPILCLVPLTATLAVVLIYQFKAKVDLAVGLTLLAFAALRVSEKTAARLAQLVKQAGTPYLFTMGILHGLTNMGGSMLSVYAASQSTSKEENRAIVATYYLSFGVIQLLTLGILKRQAFSFHSVIGAIAAVGIYALIGRQVFARAQVHTYQRALTGFMAAYGMAVLVKASL